MNHLDIPPGKLGFDDERARLDFMRSKNEERVRDAWEYYEYRKRRRERAEKAELLAFWSMTGFLAMLVLALVLDYFGVL